MRTVSFADKSTGLFIGRTYSTFDASLVEAQTPEGCIAIDGIHDHLSKRYDLESKKVIDYQPPQPSQYHEWNYELKRWEKSKEVAAHDASRAEALDKIAKLEAKQARRVRELLASEDQMLKDIDSEIAGLREILASSHP